MLAGEGRERGQVRLGVDQHLSDSEGNGSLRVSTTCLYWAATAWIVLGFVEGWLCRAGAAAVVVVWLRW